MWVLRLAMLSAESLHDFIVRVLSLHICCYLSISSASWLMHLLKSFLDKFSSHSDRGESIIDCEWTIAQKDYKFVIWFFSKFRLRIDLLRARENKICFKPLFVIWFPFKFRCSRKLFSRSSVAKLWEP